MDEYQSNLHSALLMQLLNNMLQVQLCLSGGCTDNHVYVHVAICMIEYVESMTI